jgi:hypothetical protein
MRSIWPVTVLLLLSACSAAGGWAKAGVAPSIAARDYAECRHSAELAFRRDRDIDTDIIASRGQDWQRIGVLQNKTEAYADSNEARESDVVSRCMIDKGYSGG